MLFSHIITIHCVFFLLAFCCCIFNSATHHTISRNHSHLSPFLHGRGLKKSSPSLHLAGLPAYADDAFAWHLLLLCFGLLPDGLTTCELGLPQKNRNETQLKPFAFPSVQGGCLNQPQQRGLELGPGLVWTSEELERDVDLTLTVAEIT